MTIPTLAFLLSLNLSTSWAAWSDNCPSGTTAGINCKQCGTDCAFTQTDSGMVTVYGSGRIAGEGASDGYTYNQNKKGYYDANGNPHPFSDNKSITGLQFAEGSSITEIGWGAFAGTQISGTVRLPDTLLKLEDSAIFGMYPNHPVFEIPDTIEYVGGSDALEQGEKIICRGENCEDVMQLFIDTEGDFADNFHLATSDECSGNYGWDGELCVRKDNDGKFTCNDSYGWSGTSCVEKDSDGNFDCDANLVYWNEQCLNEYPFAKKRWTPAEANEWLHDGNDNFVVITFKK